MRPELEDRFDDLAWTLIMDSEDVTQSVDDWCDGLSEIQGYLLRSWSSRRGTRPLRS